MFNYSKYKKDAKEQLKGNWSSSIIFNCVLIAIFLLLFFALGRLETTNRISYELFSLIGLGIYGIAITVFDYSFLKISRERTIDTNDIFNALGDFWLKGILGILWMIVWIVFWSLIFFIPGIIKGISYSQMFFVIAENKKISVRKAMNISKIMTNGHKADLFMMTLSFLPWIVLSIITCGIGFIFLIPYMGVAFSNAYSDLKLESLRKGVLVPSDFE